MNRFIKLFFGFVFISFLLVRCAGDETVAPGLTSLITITSETAGVNCENGGVRIDYGLDNNSNGVLDNDEIASSNYVCNGADGTGVLSTVSAEQPGANCEHGGIQIHFGPDVNGNGVLDLSEITSTSYVCNGADGMNSLTSITSESAGENCTNGGVRIDIGVDVNGNGVLDTGESMTTQYVCNGVDGETSLINILNEVAGANCTDGGVRIDSGLDSNNNGTLDADEITSTQYVCNQANVNSEYVVVNEALTVENYSTNCSGCHGASLETFVERTWVYGNTIEAISSITRDGTGNGMPSYDNTFNAAEITDLANYILRETEGVTLEDLRNDRPGLSGIFTSNDLSFQTEVIATGIGGEEGEPFGVTQLPNGDFLVTERTTTSIYRVINDGTFDAITGMPNVVYNDNSQEGVLDIVIDPDFENNSRIYFSYARPNPDNNRNKSTAVASAVLTGTALTEVDEIFIALPYDDSQGHYGSRLQFDRDGFLYISVGDRDNRDEFPQNLGNSHGKIHRIMADGQAPTDNPFYAEGGVNESIFAIGIRNPQGLTIHPTTGDIWSGEHGPQGGDEINIISSGNNYGWPVITYGEEYGGGQIGDGTEQDGMEQPVVYWTPSIAPCGMSFIDSEFYGAWQNDLFVGTLAGSHLRRLVMDGNTVVSEEVLLDGVGRIRDVHQGNDGFMYILMDDPGRLIRIIPIQ